MKFSLAQILLEESSFRHNGDFLQADPKSPRQPTQVGIGVELLQSANDTDAAVRLIVRTGDDTGSYSYHVKYLVLFKLEDDGEETDDFGRRLMITGATMAFPFAREMVANLTSRGRFGPTWLVPTDFNRLVPANPQATTIAGDAR